MRNIADIVIAVVDVAIVFVGGRGGSEYSNEASLDGSEIIHENNLYI